MNWQKQLKELKYSHLERTAPAFFKASGGRTMKLKPYSDKTANGLTRCIIDFLTFSGWQAERITNTGRMIDRRRTYTDVLGRKKQIGGMEWAKGTGTAGTADLSATIAGRSVKIEVKIGRDRQSAAQTSYQKKIEASGGIYFIATNMQDFIEWFYLNFKTEIYEQRKSPPRFV
ncbi:hypothetical protein [Agriterribacter sp.]|uniref:hypothetical protein n=1 Tax=Agriterribacter sp. TaxID=2821509 RepID=UPI002CAC2C7C|nr:hypothetical protein [Agriterribacter sp.]HRO47689.1 hypothetical protein [Agriterribacter sp.]HRQ17670.1 hypothetical protein [Agriterribacter sp.]